MRVPVSQFSLRKNGKADSVVITVIARSEIKADISVTHEGGSVSILGKTISFSEKGADVK